ncbi:FxsA family protein [Actinocorallia sp. API 0066]|uniref:FxsA family protein n=1 Tax=Actinocorallia sp. API 0066 TaxID=2896846 RepID=UPI001E5DA321|nr:FxsA family protein [Actinocorallia sp. API 0066]MCD0450067.1 FxsA family protein [Actinocorallia sp. API 0066]
MWPLLFPLLFVLVPILEIYVIVQVAHAIGGGWTLLLLLAETALGLWIVKREGRRAWSRLNTTVAQGRMPDTELADGFLILLGGGLLIVPGFVTDVVGLLCVLPFTRPLVRRLVMVWAARRAARLGPPPGFPGTFQGGPQGGVVRGEVIEEDDAPPPPVRGQIVRGDIVDDDETDDKR